jgi:phenylacetate-CoA ligase
MGAFEVIKKFIESNWVIEKAAREVLERFPLSFRYSISYGPSFRYWLGFLRESEKWDRNKFNDYQLEQLKKLLRYSMKNISYYRKLFSDYGINPEKIQSLTDIKSLPYLSKETVRDRLEEFIDESVLRKSLLKDSTSGSTGIPLTIYGTKESVGIYYAFLYNSLNRIGYFPKFKEVKFWNIIELGKNKKVPFIRYGNKLILSNRYFTDEWLFKYIEMIRKFKPKFITGYPSILSIFSMFIKSKDILSFKDLKAIIVYGETLYDWQRTLIEEVFDTRVFSTYGMTESSLFASECEYSTSQHVYPQSGFVEFAVMDSGYEEIVVTGFNNYAMPLIRYKTNDLGIKANESCHKCGRHYQLIDKIEGRINDFLINKEGKVIPRLMPWIKIFPDVRQIQFFQEEPGKAYLKVVKAETYSKTDSIYIRSKLEEMLGPMKDTINIEIVFVEDIPRPPSGKMSMTDQRLDLMNFIK